MPRLRDFTASNGQISFDSARQHAALIGCLYAGDPIRFDQIHAMPGGQSRRAQWFLTPTWGMVRLAVVTQPGFIFIHIGGTHRWTQWVRHITGAQGSFLPNQPPCMVHTFHNKVAKAMVEGPLDLPWDTLQGVQIRIAGHSLGGAVAHLLGKRFSLQTHPSMVQVLTFGEPRCVTQGYREAQPVQHWRFVNTGDIVPHMPPPWAPITSAREEETPLVGAFRRLTLDSVLDLWNGPEDVRRVPTWQHYGRAIKLDADGTATVDTEGDTLTFASFRGGSTATFETHKMPGYLLRLWEHSDRFGGSVESTDAVRLALDAQHAPTAEAGTVDVDPNSYADLSSINQSFAPGTVPPPFTLERASETQSVELTAQGVSLDPPVGGNSTIGAPNGAGGSSVAAWKYTAYLSWGKYGRSVSIHRTGPADFAQARADALNWVGRYASMLGDAEGVNPLEGQFQLGIPGAPVIEWIRVSDPTTPRISQRYRVPYGVGHGAAALTYGFESDIPWVGLSMTILATLNTRVTRDVVSILGQPDGVCERGGYDGGYIMQNEQPFSTVLTNYLAFILPPNGIGWGTMGRDYANAPNVPITHFGTGTDGQANIWADTANWLTGETIKIIGSKVPYYNREWLVQPNDDGSYVLVGSRPNQAPMPKAATGYRTKLATGVKQIVFYPYSERADSFKPEDRIFVAKRDPARAYTPLASRRSRRTPPK
jgi:hypothetical protein